MESEVRRTGWKGLGIGFLLGLLVAGIPLVLLLLRPPPVIVVNPPTPVATAAVRNGTPEDVEKTKEPVPPPRGSRKKKEESGEVAGGSQTGGDGEAGGTALAPPQKRQEKNPEKPKETAEEHEERLRMALRDSLKVTVVDAETGAPLPGVDIRLFLGTFQRGGMSGGPRTKKDGSAELDPLGMFGELKAMMGRHDPAYARLPFGTEEDPLRADVTIRVPGYKAFRGDAIGDKLEVKLEKEAAPRPFGALTGRLLDPEGAGWTKPTVVSLQDPVVVDSIASWVFPGSDGRFELTGVPAGAWGVKLTDCWGTRQQVEVPSGGAVEVTLHLNEDDVDDNSPFPETRRAVSVTAGGRDFPYGAAILLQGDWGPPILAAAPGGTATFPAVPVGAVRVVLRRPDGGDETFSTVVAEGEGVQAVPFPAPK